MYREIAAPVNDVEVRVGALVMLSGGATLHYQRAMFAAVEEARGQWRIECEDGALDLNMLPGSPQVTVRRHTANGVQSQTLADGPFEWSEIHRGPVVDFAAAIIEGREPLTSLDNALTMQRLADAIYQSAKNGTAVPCGEAGPLSNSAL